MYFFISKLHELTFAGKGIESIHKTTNFSLLFC